MSKKKLTSFLSILLLLAGWQVFASWINQPELIPSLPQLIQTLGNLFTSAGFYLSIIATISRGVLGMLLSLVAALGIAGLFAKYELMYELFKPLLAIMRSIPVISFILLALIFLNTESIPLLIAFLTMFPLLTENLTKGIHNLRPGYSIMGRLFQISPWNKLTQIIYPQLKPFLYSGLSSAAGFGWRAIIMGEVLSQCSFGIGSEMKKAQTFIAVPELMAWTLTAILISFLFDKGIGWIARYSIPIQYNKVSKLVSTNSDHLINMDLQLIKVSYLYGIKNFSYLFNKGKIYGISAPSGAGKTTLFGLINGTLLPTEGKIHFNHQLSISNVFQEPELLPHLTAIDNIALALAQQMNEVKALATARNFLQTMEIEALKNRYPRELSYGQQQRISIARALAYPAPLLLMDEPFKGLDESLCYRILTKIKEKQLQDKQTIIFTSHNPDELKQLAEVLITLP